VRVISNLLDLKRKPLKTTFRVDSGNLRKHSLLAIAFMISKYIFMHINSIIRKSLNYDLKVSHSYIKMEFLVFALKPWSHQLLQGTLERLYIWLYFTIFVLFREFL
jgi:hypothetical protein